MTLISNILHLFFLLISFLYRANAFYMTLHPIHSPRLKILPESFTMKERHQFLRNISLARAFHVNKNNAKLSPNSIDYLHSSLSQGYFITQLSFGDQDQFTPYVIVDTSTDITWIQCAKCKSCFVLKDPIYAENSTTYSVMDVANDKRCTQKIFEGTCGFDDDLGRGHVVGYLGTDQFSFSNANGRRVFYPDIAFGCGINNTGFDFGSDNKIAGVHGIGLGPRSFIQQIPNEIKGRFSYCIPRNIDHDTTISFGDAAQPLDGAQTISMKAITAQPKSYYHIYMAAISVNGVRLGIKSFVFELDSANYTRGFFIDPSTPNTMLTKEAYIELTKALEGNTDGDKFCLTKDPPTIGFHFVSSHAGGGETTLILDKESAFDNKKCLLMYSTDGPSIFGAYQQTNIRFLYEIQTSPPQLSFKPDTC